VVAGGDDYELCFTAPADKRDAVVAAGERAGVAVTRVGAITHEPGLSLLAADGAPLTFEHTGYDHFAA
jgi:thiamine-monophosphate kinase